MKSLLNSAIDRWQTSRRLRLHVTIALAVYLLVMGYYAVFRRQSDFDWHLNVGKAFLAGDPYTCNSDHYPLGRTMFNGVLAALPMRLAKLGMFVVGVASLSGIIFIWRRMVAVEDPSGRVLSAVAMAATMVLFAHYITRDLDECGLQVLLLLMLSAGAFALWCGRPWKAGFWLAMAVSYKATPILFLPFLLWKRQWRAAAAMGLFIIAINLLPAAWLGWDKMLSCNAQWFARARSAAAVKDPALSPILHCPPEPRNFGLQVSLARYLEHCWYPPESQSPQNHPLYVHFGSLEPETAGIVVKGILLAMAAGLAWWFRHPWPALPPQSDGAGQQRGCFASEWAVVTLLSALLSPFCWKQHLVLAIPCLFLVLKDLFRQDAPSRGRMAVLALIAVLVICTKRFPWGQQLSIVVASYKPDTIAMLLTLGMTVTIARRERPSISMPHFQQRRAASAIAQTKGRKAFASRPPHAS